MWSNFTQKNLMYFKNNSLIIDDNNNLIKLLNSEQNNIILFIKKNYNFKIIINKVIDINIDEHLNSDWVCENDIKEINNKLINNYIIKWKNIKNELISNKITIKSYSCKNILLRIRIIILFIEYLKIKSNNKNKKVNIFLILTKLKKYFPNNNKIIDINNVNSGYSSFLENIIFIWRLEEVEKVLFHELIHFFNLDGRNININLDFNIEGINYYFESITDFWGIFYNLIYISILTKYPLKNLLEIEFTFIKNQASILNKFFKLNDWSNIDNLVIKQNTSAFSYYILKYLLFDFIINQNINITNNIHLNNKLFVELFKIIKNKKFVNYNYLNLKSSRMTLFQLK
jgi:hypothetical protein